MFKTKRTPTAKKDTKASGNAFVKAGMKNSAVTKSGNGAFKYSTTGLLFVDQFGKLGSYKAVRSYEDVSRDMSELYALNRLMALRFILYMRIITRTIQLPDGNKTETVQRGAGLKNEPILRMLWLAINHPTDFMQLVPLFITCGSWLDIIKMLQLDIVYNGWENRQLNWTFLGKVILAGLENDGTTNLVKKYLPQIKANSQCKTIEAEADNTVAKWICSLLYGAKQTSGSYKLYRKLKSSGNAHEWQKLISQKKFLSINFNTVAGRALAQLVSGKFIENCGLKTVYTEWIESQPIAKFTGYPHELFKDLGKKTRQYQIQTLNKQFDGLVETAKKGAKKDTSLIVVRDTSNSMSSNATGTTQSCFEIGKALALFFSAMLPEGHFADSWIEFNSDAQMHNWKGSTPYEKWNNDRSRYVGGTDFQSVIHLLVRIKRQGVPESEFPTGILCISDSEFNPASLGITNVAQALATLKAGGFSDDYIAKFQIVLWNLQNSFYGKGSGEKFETYGNTPNVYYFSGYDGSVVAFLTGMEESKKAAPKNAEELFEAAMDQEVLNLVN
jgi:hypothetical protein